MESPETVSTLKRELRDRKERQDDQEETDKMVSLEPKVLVDKKVNAEELVPKVLLEKKENLPSKD